MTEINKYFVYILENYWHCEVRGLSTGAELRRLLNRPNDKINETTFKNLLKVAIEQHRFHLKEYEKITGLDFESPDEISDDLRILWKWMYGVDLPG